MGPGVLGVSVQWVLGSWGSRFSGSWGLGGLGAGLSVGEGRGLVVPNWGLMLGSDALYWPTPPTSFQ